MPKCGCSGSTCSCDIRAGEGITVTGNGSDVPYEISVTGGETGGVDHFVDTETLAWTVVGDDGEDRTVSADVQVSMSEITDFTCAAPAAGDVVQWDGTGWVCASISAAPGSIAVGDGLAGDGSAGDPLVLDVTLGQGLSGTGSPDTPLQVAAIDWPYPGHTDDSTQDDGVPVYFASDGSLLVPRGVYGWQVDSGGEWDPERAMGDNSDTVYRNPVTVALGAHDDPVYRYFSVARRDSTVTTRHGESEVYHTFSDGMSMLAFKVVSTSEKAAGDSEQDSAAWFYMRRDGQMYVRSDALTQGTVVTRPLPFAQQQGSARLEGASDEVRTVVVTFASGRFTATPRVFMQTVTGTSAASLTNTETWVTNVTTASAQLNVNRNNSTPVNVWWMAVQEESVSTVRLSQGPFSSDDEVGLPGHPHPVVFGAPGDDVPMGTAICHTLGCANRNVPIEVPLGYTEDGITYNPTYVCGVCGEPINDIQVS